MLASEVSEGQTRQPQAQQVVQKNLEVMDTLVGREERQDNIRAHTTTIEKISRMGFDCKSFQGCRSIYSRPPPPIKVGVCMP